MADITTGIENSPITVGEIRPDTQGAQALESAAYHLERLGPRLEQTIAGAGALYDKHVTQTQTIDGMRTAAANALQDDMDWEKIKQQTVESGHTDPNTYIRFRQGIAARLAEQEGMYSTNAGRMAHLERSNAYIEQWDKRGVRDQADMEGIQAEQSAVQHTKILAGQVSVLGMGGLQNALDANEGMRHASYTGNLEHDNVMNRMFDANKTVLVRTAAETEIQRAADPVAAAQDIAHNKFVQDNDGEHVTEYTRLGEEQATRNQAKSNAADLLARRQDAEQTETTIGELRAKYVKTNADGTTTINPAVYDNEAQLYKDHPMQQEHIASFFSALKSDAHQNPEGPQIDPNPKVVTDFDTRAAAGTLKPKEVYDGVTNNQFSYAFAEKRWPGVLHPEHDPAAADAKLIYNKRLTATFAYVQKTIAPTSGVIGGIVPPGAAAGVMKLHNFVLDRMAEADQRGEDKNELLDPSSSKYILGGAVMERVGGLKGSDLIKELVNTGGYAAEPRTLMDAFYNSEALEAAADPTKARDKENTVDAAWAAYKTAHPGVTDTTPTHRGAPAAAKSYTLPKAGPGRAAALQYWAQHGTWPGE